jgi:hypothetical protein
VSDPRPRADEPSLDASRPAAEVSIVISNHDYAEFVLDAIGSARAQRRCRVEVIVVDDGSTDGSRALLERYEHELAGGPASPPVTIVRQANGGQAAAMNTGFALATAPVVIFLDADDVLHPHVAHAAARAFEDPDVARLQYPMRVIDRAGRATGDTVPSDPGRLARGDVRAAVLSHPDDVVWQPTSGNAFRASVLRELLPMPEAPYRGSADYYLSNLTALHGRVEVLGVAGADYRIHGRNADYRRELDLDRVRTILTRTRVTHRELAAEAARLGLDGLPDDPLAVRSVTFLANRLVSRRLEPDLHVFAPDRPLRLVAGGVVAAGRRGDLPAARRCAYAAWFAATALAPRPLARRLAARALVAPVPGAPRVRADWRALLPPIAPAARIEVRGDRDGTAAAALAELDLFVTPPSVSPTDAAPAVAARTADRNADDRAADDRTAGDRTAGDRTGGDRAVGGFTDRRPSPAPLDLAVVLAPAVGELDTSLAQLSPTGLALVEVDRRSREGRRLSPRRVARMGARYGLTVASVHAAAPRAEDPRRYVPLDHGGALAWYAATLVVPGSVPAQVATSLLRLLGRLDVPQVAAALAPSFVAVLAPTAAGDRGDALVPAALTAATPGSVAPGTRTVVLTSGQDGASRTVLLPFGPGDRAPRTVVKLAGDPRFNGETSRELDRLKAVRRLLARGPDHGLPAPLGVGSVGGLAVAAQTAAPGRSVDARSGRVGASRARRVRDLDDVTAWTIRSVREAGRGQLEWSPEVGRTTVVEPIDGVVQRADDGALAALARDVESFAASLAGSRLPLGPRHHDLVPANVVIGPGRRRIVSVIDWEGADGRASVGGPLDLPLLDLLLFATFWHRLVHRSRTPAEDLHHLDRLLSREGLGQDPYAAAVWHAVHRAADATAIDRRFVPILMAALWLERAARAADRRTRLGLATETDTAGDPAIDALHIVARRWPDLTGSATWAT